MTVTTVLLDIVGNYQPHLLLRMCLMREGMMVTSEKVEEGER